MEQEQEQEEQPIGQSTRLCEHPRRALVHCQLNGFVKKRTLVGPFQMPVMSWSQYMRGMTSFFMVYMLQRSLPWSKKNVSSGCRSRRDTTPSSVES